MWSAEPIVLTVEERGELERRVASPTTPQRDAKRAMVVLHTAIGMPSRQISLRIGMHESHVANWRRRFLTQRIEGLGERKHTGRPRRLGHDERLAMAAAATAAKSPDDPVAMWTLDELVDVLADTHDITVSRSQLGKILAAMDIDLRKVRGWLNRRDDPEFWARVRDVCGLYLNPPDKAIVLSVDEKTGIQAKERVVRTDQPNRAVPGVESSNTDGMASPSSSPRSMSAPAKYSQTRSLATTRSTSARSSTPSKLPSSPA
jgi:transposase